MPRAAAIELLIAGGYAHLASPGVLDEGLAAVPGGTWWAVGVEEVRSVTVYVNARTAEDATKAAGSVDLDDWFPDEDRIVSVSEHKNGSQPWVKEGWMDDQGEWHEPIAIQRGAA